MEDSFDPAMMVKALALAHAAQDKGEVPVGALVVDPATNTIISQAHNAPICLHDPTAHAEVLALRAAGSAVGNYRLTGMDLYVSLEPCTMCAAAIAQARIRRVIFAAQDVKGGAVINGVQFFGAPTCHWRPQIIHAHSFEQEAGDMLRSFFANRRRRS